MSGQIKTTLGISESREWNYFDSIGQMFLDGSNYILVSNNDWIKDNLRLVLDNLDKKIGSLIAGNIEIDEKIFLVIRAENSSKNIGSNLVNLLTERELQITTLAAHGMSNKKIASYLHISEWTVSTHVRRIFSKLNVDSRAAMVYRCASLIGQLKL